MYNRKNKYCILFGTSLMLVVVLSPILLSFSLRSDDINRYIRSNYCFSDKNTQLNIVGEISSNIDTIQRLFDNIESREVSNIMQLRNAFRDAKVNVVKLKNNIDLQGEDFLIPQCTKLILSKCSVSNGRFIVQSNTIVEGDNKSNICRNLCGNHDVECIRITGRNVKVEGLTFEGNVEYNQQVEDENQLHICIQAYNSSNIIISNCNFRNTNACIGIDDSRDIIVRDCQLGPSYENKKSGVYGYGVVFNQVVNGYIYDNTFRDIERHCVYISTHGGQSDNINSSHINIYNNYCKILDTSKYKEKHLATGFEMAIKSIGGDDINIHDNVIEGGRCAVLLALENIS